MTIMIWNGHHDTQIFANIADMVENYKPNPLHAKIRNEMFMEELRKLGWNPPPNFDKESGG